ncbi:MAG: Crp/Fnr family transcriptional regulator [Steroidobacterales bacterium]
MRSGYPERQVRMDRIDRPERAGCELCGLWRVCFPGLVASTAERRTSELRIRCLRVPRGKVLYRAGDMVRSLFMIRSGCVKEIDDSTASPGTVINFALPGEMLTLQSLGTVTSNTTSIAVEPSHVCVVPGNAFSQLGQDLHHVIAELIPLLAKAGMAARDVLTLIRDKGALQRVSGFLLSISGRLQGRGVRGRDFRLAMNRDDIANYLGLRSETVSRCFTELARRELISVHAKRVQIRNVAGLRGVYSSA